MSLETRDLLHALLGMNPDEDEPCADRCEREECAGCAMAECPFREPLHRHHDGCPACTTGAPR